MSDIESLEEIIRTIVKKIGEPYTGVTKDALGALRTADTGINAGLAMTERQLDLAVRKYDGELRTQARLLTHRGKNPALAQYSPSATQMLLSRVVEHLHPIEGSGISQDTLREIKSGIRQQITAKVHDRAKQWQSTTGETPQRSMARLVSAGHAI